jgi:hypothetical protein
MRLIAILCLMSTPALADDLVYFRAPSGNIHCIIATGSYAEARCDLIEGTLSFPDIPADCDLDWGRAFSVGEDGPGTPACAGDTTAVSDSRVLDYGDSITRGPFTCASATSGMTCTNGQGHGFTVARAGQTVF